MHRDVFFRPASGYVGDAIPFEWEGQFWVFYLLDRRRADGTPWNLVRTQDFVDFDDVGTVLPHGDADSADFNAYTGSIVEADGTHHLFYTGQNPRIVDDTTGEPLQVVMHAVSEDGMATWIKRPEDTFAAPNGRYERCDWRDPFVFRPDPSGPWRMLLAARNTRGPYRRRGAIAQCVSHDLKTWEVTEPFWDPSLYTTHECPDVFRIGEWWYLMYSEFSERFATRYRMGRSPQGPWLVPTLDTVDGRAFYAAKTVADDDSRFAVGWVATREAERDAGAWQWAGDMAAHEVRQNPDGTLAFRMPRALAASFDEPVEASFEPRIGTWERDDGTLRVAVRDGFAWAHARDSPHRYLLSFTVELAPGTTGAGVVIRSGHDADEGYAIRLEPRAGRMTFDRLPRPRTGVAPWQIGGDVPYAIELERPADLAPGAHRLDVLVDQTIFIAYLDDQVAMSGRIYDRRSGGLGLFVTEGSAAFSELTIRTRS